MKILSSETKGNTATIKTDRCIFEVTYHRNFDMHMLTAYVDGKPYEAATRSTDEEAKDWMIATYKDLAPPPDYIHRSNLARALHTAIRQREEEEYPMESALLAGWKSALKSLENNNLKIKY